MRTWYFYSVPGSTVPSPYFRRVPQMLADLSRKGILRFRLWQGTHEAPIPLEDGPEPAVEDKVFVEVFFCADGIRSTIMEFPASVRDLPPDVLWEGGPKRSYESERRALVMGRLQAAFPHVDRIGIITAKYVPAPDNYKATELP